MKTAELELAPVQPGEPPMKQIAVWDEFRTRAEKLKATAETLTITDANDRAGMALARSTRLALKEVRVAVIHRHKELKENILIEGRQIDSGKNELLALIEPFETRMLEQEQFAERELARSQAEKREARLVELTPFLFAPIAVDLGTMEDDVYTALLIDMKGAHAAKLERERKEKADAEAKVKAEAAERERIRLENERLKREATEREAAAQKEREEAARRELKAKAKANAEMDKLRKDAAVKAEKAKKEREAIEAKAKADREALEKIEAEAKKAAEDKAAAEKAAAMAPEKDKLNKFAADVRLLSQSLLATSKGADYVKEISEGVERFASWIERKALTIGGVK